MKTKIQKQLTRYASLLLAVLLLFVNSGCGTSSTMPIQNNTETTSVEDTTPSTQEATSTDLSETAYPVTVTDQAGREVTFTKEPEKIVSGYYIPSSLLIALGLSDKVVGIEAKADTRPIYKMAAPEFLELPNVGTAKEFNLETCASLNPDLVILPLKLKDAAQSLSDLNIPVLLVNPENQEQLEEMITLLSTVTNTKAKADDLISYINEQSDMLASKLASVDKPTVYLAGNSSLLSTAGPSMYQSQMIELAGAVNAAEEITDTYWANISYEQLLSWDPSYIILASDAEYTVEDVLNDLRESLEIAHRAGVKDSQIVLDPGVGFGKTYEHNLQIINECDKVVNLGFPVLLGTSRKSVIGLTLDIPAPERSVGTCATTVIGYERGCRIFRVHDVRDNYQALLMAQAICKQR